MDWRSFLSIFMAVFLAELGDKTQLATMLFAADNKSGLWSVFLAASLALVVCSGLGVLAGSLLARTIQPKTLSILAGVGFIVIGAWTLWSALRKA